ncbi:Cocaine esterase [Colletotrichum siamense]|nr:Cocaine esterase [Colletotrichum siamense]
MTTQTGPIETLFTKANSNFHNWWTEFKPSTQILPQGWTREPGRRPLKEDMIWERDVAIPLRDGVKLRADIFRPANLKGQKLPALLPWSPYGKTGSGHHQTTNFKWLGVPKSSLSGLEKFEAPDPAEWCPRGYVLVQPDARGCFNSEGDIAVFGTQEGRDGYDTIEWIAEQPWCNKSVALVGNSWLAITQWFIAAEQPPHLKAIAPWEGLGDFYRESICRGGIPNFKFWDLLMQEFNGLNKREDVVAMINKYPLMNEYWEDKKPKLQNIKIPMYILASYSTGLHTEGSIRGWKYSASNEKWLRIHPTQEWFDIYQPETNDDLQRFLDHYLLANDNGWELTPKVRLSLLRYNAPPISFRAEDNYPPSRVQYKTFYLNSSEGKLQDKAPATDAVTSYQSDSWKDDGAHFTLKFDKYTELCGFSRAKLFVSCQDFDDMDVYLIIRKIDRNGKALLNYNIPSIHQKPGQKPEDIPDENIYKYVGPSGRLRASKRMTAEEPGLTDEMRARKNPTELWYPHYESQKVVPGDVVELDIAIWPGGIVFEEGESLRFEIKGHDPILPEYPPLFESLENLNIGKHNVHCGPSFPSYVMLPLITY